MSISHSLKYKYDLVLIHIIHTHLPINPTQIKKNKKNLLLIYQVPLNLPMLQIPRIPPNTRSIRTNLIKLRLSLRGQRIPRPGDYLTRHTQIARSLGQSSFIISREGRRRLAETLVIEELVLGSLFRSRHGGNGVLFSGVVGDGCALWGHFGEGAALVGGRHFVFLGSLLLVFGIEMFLGCVFVV